MVVYIESSLWQHPTNIIPFFGLAIATGHPSYDLKALHMSSVMHEMRLASTVMQRSFEQRLAMTGMAAGQAQYLAFVGAMQGWLPPFERQLWSLDWPAHRRLAQADMALAAASARAAVESRDRWFQKTDMA